MRTPKINFRKYTYHSTILSQTLNHSCMEKSFDFAHAPGHLVRRAQQIAVALFMTELAAEDVTPVQFAILNAVMDTPGIDQITLAGRVAFDAATSGSVIGRLEAKGWIQREADRVDRRRKLLWLTPSGQAATLLMKTAVERVQDKLLKPLNQQEAQQLVDLLAKLVDGHESEPNSNKT
jgi:DNA-binding MarR family transcriptional regulator